MGWGRFLLPMARKAPASYYAQSVFIIASCRSMLSLSPQGALEEVIAQSTHAKVGNEVVSITDQMRLKLVQRTEQMNSQVRRSCFCAVSVSLCLYFSGFAASAAACVVAVCVRATACTGA